MPAVETNLSTKENTGRVTGPSPDLAFGTTEFEKALPFQKKLTFFRKDKIEPR